MIPKIPKITAAAWVALILAVCVFLVVEVSMAALR